MSNDHDGLPPLPFTDYSLFYEAPGDDTSEGWQEVVDAPGYTANQMRAYAIAALATKEAELAALRVDAGWRQIEEAPESGYFMVYEDEAYRLKLRHEGKWCDIAYAGIVCAPWGDLAVGADAQRMLDQIGPGHKLVVRDGCCDNPTHWRPLPAPPAIDQSLGNQPATE
jgi:NCAIR mutase (PurE)-related protein